MKASRSEFRAVGRSWGVVCWVLAFVGFGLGDLAGCVCIEQVSVESRAHSVVLSAAAEACRSKSFNVAVSGSTCNRESPCHEIPMGTSLGHYHGGELANSSCAGSRNGDDSSKPWPLNPKSST